MADRFRFDDIRLSVSGKADRARAKPVDDAPFRMLVLADFSGRESRRVVEPLAGRQAVPIDVDNVDQSLARLTPTLDLASAEGNALSISFQSIDDFHPDRIFSRLPIFERLSSTTSSRAGGEPESGTTAGPPGESTEETLARLLGRTAPAPAAKPPPASEGVEAFIKGIVAPHVVPAADPRAAIEQNAKDHACAVQMRAILHSPVFQALEAAWRGIDFLVRNLETDESLQVWMLDVSKAEIAADLRTGDNLADSAIFKLLVEESVQSRGADPWALLVGGFTFGSADDDADMLARIGRIAAAAGAPFIGGAAPEFVEAALSGGAITGGAWEALRKLPQAASIGLVAPRFLLRLPYGRTTEPIESFAFEEISDPADHERFLWGNPAIACACLLGQSFRENGWSFEPGDLAELNGLPVHTSRQAAESVATPCAERWLTDRHASDLLASGIMPLVSIRGRDAVRLIRFQSIAVPPQAIAGRWER